MLYNMPYPISSGISYVPMNLLDMQNKGIEFTISATPIQTKDFIWNLSFNGTHYSNKILNLPEDKRENGIIHGTASLFRLMEGGSIYDLYTYEYAGVNPETGAAQWYMDEKDANGKVTGRTVTEDYTQASKYELGSTLPDFQGGFSTDFAYKGIDLSIATNFQIGGKIYDSMYSSFMHAGSNIGSNWHKDILNAWTPENKNTNVPIMDGAQNSNSQSSRFLINASFFNIRNISLGYTFPKEWMKAISASSARIYVSADNVALFFLAITILRTIHYRHICIFVFRSPSIQDILMPVAANIASRMHERRIHAVIYLSTNLKVCSYRKIDSFVCKIS